MYRFPATDTAGARFVGWSEKGSTTVSFNEPGFVGTGFALVPDRFGNIGYKFTVRADSHDNIVINLGIITRS